LAFLADTGMPALNHLISFALVKSLTHPQNFSNIRQRNQKLAFTGLPAKARTCNLNFNFFWVSATSTQNFSKIRQPNQKLAFTGPTGKAETCGENFMFF
jgi:hypothetical protein